MVRFVGDIHSLSRVLTFVLCCCGESYAFNLRSSRRIYSPSSAVKNTLLKTSSSYPSKYSIRQPLLATTSGGGSNFEKSFATNSTNAAATATWDNVLVPSSTTSAAHTEITAVDRLGIAIFASCSISAVLAIILKSPGSWRFFLAGGLCAAISHTIPTPVDVIKVSHVKKGNTMEEFWKSSMF